MSSAEHPRREDGFLMPVVTAVVYALLCQSAWLLMIPHLGVIIILEFLGSKTPDEGQSMLLLYFCSFLLHTLLISSLTFASCQVFSRGLRLTHALVLGGMLDLYYLWAMNRGMFYFWTPGWFLLGTLSPILGFALFRGIVARVAINEQPRK